MSEINREEVIRRRIAELEGELAQRLRYGRDTYEDGAVLSWVKTYPMQPDKVYRYAALKADGQWYVTAKPSPSGWDGLVQLWTSAETVETVQVMRVGGVLGASKQPETIATWEGPKATTESFGHPAGWVEPVVDLSKLPKEDEK